MKTIVGLFDSYYQAEQTLRDLERAGYGRDRVTLIANEPARDRVATSDTSDEGESADIAEGAGTGAVIGGVAGSAAGLIASLAGLAIPGIGPVLAAGPLVGLLTGAGVGAAVGGLVGALITAGVPQEHAHYYAEGVRRGGSLVVVSADDDEAERLMEIMNRHNPVDIQERALAWRQKGFTIPGSSTRVGGETAAVGGETAIPAAAADFGETFTGAGARTGADFDNFESDFRSNYQATHRGSDYDFDQAKPAYRYGCELAGDGSRAGDWSAVEPDARRRWEQRNPGTWEKFKDAARYAYDRARSKV